MSVRGALIAIGLALLAEGCFPGPPDGSPRVVVVHGLGRTAASMAVLEARLEQAGYAVVSFDYPSRDEPIEALVERLSDELDACCEGGVDVDFVTHSMGGVIVRSLLDGRGEPYGGRVVMLAPPSQGSEVIDWFRDSPLLEVVVGPAGLELGTDSAGIARRLGPVDFELGVITGDRSFNPIGSWIIPGPDDGKVGVGRARVEGAADFLVVPATHTFIMNRSDVAEQVLHFLAEGRFR